MCTHYTTGLRVAYESGPAPNKSTRHILRGRVPIWESPRRSRTRYTRFTSSP